MRETNLNFSRCTVHPHQITWFASLLSSLVQSSAKAQPVTESNSAPHTPYLELTWTVLTAAAAAIIVVLLFSMFLRWCTDSSAAAYLYPGNATTRGLDPAVVETFPVLVYSAAEVIMMGEESLECAICLAKLEGGEMLRLLPKCNHVFHPVCIDTWLASHVTCPVCRANLTPESTEMSKDENQQAMAAPNQENSAVRFNRTRDGIVITIDEEQNRDSQLAVVQSASQESNRQPKSGIPVKFPRSHSTGHSLDHCGGEDTERHTLRLPDELRRQLMTTANTARTRSFNVFSGREWSSRRGYRSGGDGNRGRPIGTGPSSDRYSQ